MDSMRCLFLHLCSAEQLVWQEHNEMLFLNKISWYLGFQGAYKTYLTKTLCSHRSHVKKIKTIKRDVKVDSIR